MKEPRRKWTSEEKDLLFKILGAIKQRRNQKNYKKSQEWRDDCAEAANILSQLLGETIRPSQIEGQTLFPTSEKFKKYSKSNMESFGYALIHKYITVYEFNHHYLNKKKK